RSSPSADAARSRSWYSARDRKAATSTTNRTANGSIWRTGSRQSAPARTRARRSRPASAPRPPLTWRTRPCTATASRSGNNTPHWDPCRLVRQGARCQDKTQAQPQHPRFGVLADEDDVGPVLLAGLARLGPVPDQHRAVGAAGDQKLPVRREGETAECAVGRCELSQFLRGPRVPETDRSIGARRRQHLAVRREDDRRRRAELGRGSVRVRHDVETFRPTNTPEGDAAITAGSGGRLAIGREGDRLELVVQAGEASHLLARGRVPQQDGIASFRVTSTPWILNTAPFGMKLLSFQAPAQARPLPSGEKASDRLSA